MSDSDDYEIFDEEIDSKKHDKIVEEVLNLNKIQNVKKPSRTEPTLNISEFNLVKSVTGDKGSVHLSALTEILKGRKKHIEISKKVQVSSKSKTLPTPLEKPQADRIRRSVNYEKSRLQLDRWEALVTSNRVAPQLVFPLNSTEKLKIEQKKSETYPSTWRIKSELQKELEKLEPKVEEYHINEEGANFPLTLKALKARRREAAKLLAHQSYKEAKARRQNKIKSKKYHRILRREKIKQKLKEFEELQKTNPEEALKKLEDIEKARAEERFSLRHKGTGQWARNKQIRAKYDKESRQVLAQQLAISRDLTQKLKNGDSDSEDENVGLEEKSEENIVNLNKEKSKENVDNSWFADIEPSKEVENFVTGYRKYWSEKSKETDNAEEKIDSNEDSNEQIDEELSEKVDEVEKRENKLKIKQITDKKKGLKNTKTKKKNELQENRTNKAKKKNSISTSDLLENGNDVEDIFEKFEEKLQKKLKNKSKKLNDQKSTKKTKKARKKVNKTQKIDLTMPSQTKKPVIDEQLAEQQSSAENENTIDSNLTTEVNRLKDILDTAVEPKKSSDVDPQGFKLGKTTYLSSANPDILTTDENDDNNQLDIFVEGFHDDDLEEQFKKEKENEVKKDTPGDIDLNLPGWGSWAGTNINTKKRRKRFIIKMPPKMPRRDDNKGSLIINEKAQAKIKPHMVSELPFPFKRVKDYEASVRAPIGNTFVPETAFRRLIEPSVITKMGAIIDPITKSVLIGEKKV